MTNVIISLLDTRTPTLFKVGSSLIEEGINVHFFSNELFDEIYQIENYLLLNGSANISCKNELRDAFKKIYHNDRSLHYYYNETNALNLMQGWYDKAINYIETYNIEFCLIEGTPAHELVMEMACIDSRVKIINIFHAPGPRGWSLVSKRSVEYPLYSNSDLNVQYIKEVRVPQTDPKSYLDVHHTRFQKFKRLIKRKRNFNYYPKWFILLKILKFQLNIFLRALLRLANQRQHNHVFYLHEEPERTIYNCGAPFSSQIEALNFITKSLGIEMSVKEHPAHVGTLPISFYLKVLLHPKLNYISRLSKKPKLVWTFSGSIAWERTRDKLPVVSLGQTYLHKSKYVYGFPEVNNFIKKYDGDFFEFVASKVFKGELSGTHWIPSEITDENIANLTKIVKHCVTSDA